MKTLFKGNHAIRISRNGEVGRFIALHLCNIEEGLNCATVLESRFYNTEKSAEKWGNKILENI